MEKAPKPKTIVFFKVVVQIWENAKNGFLAKIASGREKKNAHFRTHYLFWPKIFWAQNSENQEKL